MTYEQLSTDYKRVCEEIHKLMSELEEAHKDSKLTPDQQDGLNFMIWSTKKLEDVLFIEEE